uniref:BTB domain-containing protein n=1 Tax=Meloidogyne javanica TaxID=6303 RepID=A0A915MFM2_MELJA
MKTITTKFDWTVYNLKKIREAISNSSNLHLTSDLFSCSEFPTLGWELHLFLGGEATVWLRQIGPDNIKNALVNTKYKIYAEQYSTWTVIAKSTYKFENNDKMGFSIISLDSFLNHKGKKQWPEYSTLFLHCEVEFDCYNLTLDLQEAYLNMFENETFTDFVIKVDDEIIKTHRCVLAQNSVVFQRMFDQNLMIEAQKGEVIISDTSPECVRAMLEFFYTGKINDALMESHVEGIFAIAHKYEVDKLKYICERFMASQLNSNNIVKYIALLDKLKANELNAPTLEKRLKAGFESNT